MNSLDIRVRKSLQSGLPIVAEPYAELARELGVSESEILDTIRRMQQDGLVKRFGMVLRHRQLGYTANAMVVWDVPDNEVDEVGNQLASETHVTLSYRRPRRRPAWNYNLFCMIHGKSRVAVLAELSDIIERNGLHRYAHDVLFSTHCFKQRGGAYV